MEISTFLHPKPKIIAGAPRVLVSNLDNHPLPHLGPALKLAEAARAAGWYVRTGYAKAEVPDQLYANGNPAKAAHLLESLGVWFRRPGHRGWASWHREDEGGWRFAYAFVGIQRYGWSTSAKTKLPSVLEGIKI